MATTVAGRGRARRAARAGVEGLARPLRLADDDRPQARRPPLLLGDARLLRRGRRRGAADAHAARGAEQRPDRAEHLRPALHRPRDDDDLLVHHPDDDRRVRELLRAADDRGAGHGLPADERAQLLGLPRLRHLPLHRPVHGLRRPTPAGSTTSRSRPGSTTPGGTSSSTPSDCSSTASRRRSRPRTSSSRSSSAARPGCRSTASRSSASRSSPPRSGSCSRSRRSPST